MDYTEHDPRSALREDDSDLHQTRRVNDDAVELLACPTSVTSWPS